MIELIGLIGVLCCAFASVPQVIKTFKDGHAKGVSIWYVGILQFGTLMMLINVIATTIGFTWILLDYSLSFLLIGILIWFKLFRK